MGPQRREMLAGIPRDKHEPGVNIVQTMTYNITMVPERIEEREQRIVRFAG
jgi:hypothetical protein